MRPDCSERASEDAIEYGSSGTARFVSPSGQASRTSIFSCAILGRAS